MRSVGGRGAGWLTGAKQGKLSSAARALRGCLNALAVPEEARWTTTPPRWSKSSQALLPS